MTASKGTASVAAGGAVVVGQPTLASISAPIEIRGPVSYLDQEPHIAVDALIGLRWYRGVQPPEGSL
jgi:hypothetical protein